MKSRVVTVCYVDIRLIGKRKRRDNIAVPTICVLWSYDLSQPIAHNGKVSRFACEWFE